MKEQLKIKASDFVGWYTPAPGYALIEKDISSEKMGGLWVPPTSRDRSAKYAGTGIIRKLSPFIADREPYDADLRKIYEVGQRVAFSNMTPFEVNLPAFCTIEKREHDAFLVLLHIADIFGIIDMPTEVFDGQN